MDNKFPTITNCQNEALLEMYDDGKLNGRGYHSSQGQITNGLVKKGYLKATIDGRRELTSLAIMYIDNLNKEVTNEQG